ncbi:unnamed protein product, partial [Ectocarpus sp. 13 AM-2016]
MASTDRDSLLALFNATDGANWKNNNRWGTDADLSQWNGVGVNDQGRVVELDLRYNKLRGPIPPQLANLGALNLLDLSANELI